MANRNSNLIHAKKAKNDEFYTQLSDIENELRHYKAPFRDKTVLCNCDDPRVSNFTRYFLYNFDNLGLRRLISTCYRNSQPDLFSDGEEDRACYLDFHGEIQVRSEADIQSLDFRPLEGDGDFRSLECIEFLKQADIVCTNPPFSLFREYVAQLMEYGKEFIVIGNKNAINYKEIFPLIKENRIWIGMRSINQDMWLLRPDDSDDFEKIENGKKIKHIMGCWYTNIDIPKRHEGLILCKSYYKNPELYPKYDNYDAIEVSKTADIPYDYEGIMGVPITFMDKYNPEQFEIVGASQRVCHPEEMELKKYDNYKEMKPDGTPTGSSGSKTNGNPNIAGNDGKHNYFINAEGHVVQSLYGRIFIRRR